ncbi:MAG: hypothetical protein K2H12_08470 [Acetatifactor sp.]|nr:hypothetical protein [Acetatifactor sp.]
MSGELKYPVLLVHGMGYRDSKYINYWGRIPAKLEENGCKVYYGNQDSNGTVESNGAFLAEKIKEIIEETGAEKLNVIAHSKGGLDMRYAISSLKMSKYIASLTTISTPHNGSLTVDKLLKFPKFMVKFVACCWDVWLKICGDKNPNTYEVFITFTTAAAEEFNRNNPDEPEVHYQSYAFVMKHVWSDMFMLVPSMVVKFLEGPNDGLLAPRAVMWTNFRGIVTSSSNRGISHCDEVDMRRRKLSKKQGEGINDITDLYISIANDLREKGF